MEPIVKAHATSLPALDSVVDRLCRPESLSASGIRRPPA